MHTPLRKEHEKLARNHNEAKYRFILTELDLAITFCEIAINSNGEKSRRNTENARQAYSAAKHFLEDSKFSETMEANVEERAIKLRALLLQLDRLERNLAAP